MRSRNAMEERARDAFVDRSGTIRGGRRLDGMRMKSNEERSRSIKRATDERGKRDGCERW